MIKSFGDTLTADIFHGRRTRRVLRMDDNLVKVAARKLDIVSAAFVLEDLRVPPGNRLEALKGPLAGFHSIRVNQQWRITFRWEIASASEVTLVDYHN